MRTKRILLAAAVAVPILTLAGLWATGLATVESHRGFFAPVWDPDGRHVYFIQRDTSGVTWGPGWEHFTPPARAHVRSDSIRLQRMNRETLAVETLRSWDSPILGRVIREYRGRIFTALSARIDTDPEGVDYLVRMAIPQVPRSEVHTLRGRWEPGSEESATWTADDRGATSYGNNVLVHGKELLTVRGRESFPAAILEVAGSGEHTVLLRNDELDEIYPEGIPREVLEQRSRREQIERIGEIRRVRAEAVQEFLGQGLSRGDAELRAGDRLEELGYYPKGPRLVATEIAAAEPGEQTFEISDTELLVGLFQDIAAAIDEPGTEVEKSMGRYVIHDDFDTSRQLNAWLDSGETEFVVGARGRRYRFTLIRSE